jgi:hypothetical protein
MELLLSPAVGPTCVREDARPRPLEQLLSIALAFAQPAQEVRVKVRSFETPRRFSRRTVPKSWEVTRVGVCGAWCRCNCL